MHEALKWETLAPLAELPHGYLLAESDPRTYAYLEPLLRAETGGGRSEPVLHLDADEPLDLGRGRTPRSAATFAAHVNRVAAVVSARGARPMIWDDAIQADPSILTLIAQADGDRHVPLRRGTVVRALHRDRRPGRLRSAGLAGREQLERDLRRPRHSLRERSALSGRRQGRAQPARSRHVRNGVARRRRVALRGDVGAGRVRRSDGVASCAGRSRHLASHVRAGVLRRRRGRIRGRPRRPGRDSRWRCARRPKAIRPTTCSGPTRSNRASKRACKRSISRGCACAPNACSTHLAHARAAAQRAGGSRHAAGRTALRRAGAALSDRQGSARLLR